MNNLKERLENKLRQQEQREQGIIKVKEIETPVKTKIEIKVTVDEKEIIKSLARLQHMNVSEFIRYLALTKYTDEVLKDY